MVSNIPSPFDRPRRGFAEIALATGLASLVCAVLLLLTGMGWFVAAPGILFGLLGVIFGIVALRKRQHKGMAVTGLVTGAVGFVFLAGLYIFALLFIGAFSFTGA